MTDARHSKHRPSDADMALVAKRLANVSILLDSFRQLTILAEDSPREDGPAALICMREAAISAARTLGLCGQVLGGTDTGIDADDELARIAAKRTKEPPSGAHRGQPTA